MFIEKAHLKNSSSAGAASENHNEIQNDLSTCRSAGALVRRQAKIIHKQAKTT
jgi:hypothetical protein